MPDWVDYRALGALAGFLLVALGMLLTAYGLREGSPQRGNAASDTEAFEPKARRFAIEISEKKLVLSTGSVGVTFVLVGVLLLSLVTVVEISGQQTIKCADRMWEGDRFLRGLPFYDFIGTLCSAPSTAIRTQTVPVPEPKTSAPKEIPGTHPPETPSH